MTVLMCLICLTHALMGFVYFFDVPDACFYVLVTFWCVFACFYACFHVFFSFGNV